MTPARESQQLNQVNSLGQIVWHLRLKKGMSRSGLAAKAGLDQEFLKRLELGLEDSAAANVIHAIARALNVDVLTLIGSGSTRNEARAHWIRAQGKRKT
jgi:transcriptional regulator with XRE-family HTH domain